MKPFSRAIERLHKTLGFFKFSTKNSIFPGNSKQFITIVEPFLLGDAIIASKFASVLLKSQQVSGVAMLVDSSFCSTLEALYPDIRFIGHSFEYVRRSHIHKYLFKSFILRRILISNGISTSNDTFVDIRGDVRISFLLFIARLKNRVGFKSAGNGIFCNFVIDNTKTERNLYSEATLLSEIFGVQNEKIKRDDLILKDSRNNQLRRLLVHFGASQEKRIPPVDFSVEFISAFKGLHALPNQDFQIDICRFPECPTFADNLAQMLKKKGYMVKLVEFDTFHELVIATSVYDAVLCVDSALLHAIDGEHKSVHAVFGPSSPSSVISPDSTSVKIYFKKTDCCPCDGPICLAKREKTCYWSVLNEL